MSNPNKDLLNDSNEEDQNIKVYENDDAYMFGDDNSNDNEITPNEEINENELHKSQNSNSEKDTELNIKNQKNIEDDTIRNQQNKNIIEETNKQIKKNNITPNNNINNNLNEDNYENEENENENEENENSQEQNEEGESDGIPLITLNYISICQCCKNPFNSTINIPYLFKCGHFFCKKCIEEQFTDEEGIKCPNDGLVAYSIKELKLLNNLITDKYVESNTQREGFLNNSNLCEIHKGQKLTHYIEDTKELICVYCAFSRFKKNPKSEIKEIKEKFVDINNDIDIVIEDNQHNVEMIQGALKNIKKNKETEEKRVNNFFDQIMNFLKNKKYEIMSQIDSLFTENARKLSQKLEIFSGKIEQSENLKNAIEEYNQNSNITFLEILDNYNKLAKDPNDTNKLNIQLQEYRFNHDDESKMIKYINNFGDLKVVPKLFSFNGGKENEIQFTNFTSSNNNNNKINLSQTNEILNNSDFNNMSNVGINNTFDFKGNISQNGREKGRLFSNTQLPKNISNNKYSYSKPMTPGDYRTDYMGNDFKSFKNFNFK
jgi:hypothetical protein